MNRLSWTFNVKWTNNYINFYVTKCITLREITYHILSNNLISMIFNLLYLKDNSIFDSTDFIFLSKIIKTLISFLVQVQEQ